LHDRYGPPPEAVRNLIAVARFRLLARAAGLNEIVTSSTFIRFGPTSLPDSRVLRLKRLYPRSVVKEAAGHILVPRPLSATVGGPAVKELALLEWCSRVIEEILLPGDTAKIARDVAEGQGSR
jgi:transcription-repair coupling factor (superfamily II helicase)